MLYKLHRKLPINIPAPTPFLQRKSLFNKYKFFFFLYYSILVDHTDNTPISTPLPNVLQEKPTDNSG